MLTVELVRHAAFDGIGRRLAGRDTTVTLNEAGLRQATSLAEHFAAVAVTAVWTGPLTRAAQTADHIARRHGLEPVVAAAFDEIDYGDWTGADIADLEGDAAWHDYHAQRSMSRIPGGELLLETQARAIAGLIQLQRAHDHGIAVVVTHADVIRALLGHLLAIPMDHLLRLEIAPASVSTVELHGTWPRVLRINATS